MQARTTNVDGLVFTSLTWIIVAYNLYAEAYMSKYYYNKKSIFYAASKTQFFEIASVFFGFMKLWCHIMAVVKDPGYCSNYCPRPPENFKNPKFCDKCADCWKPPRAHHCRRCRKCVFRMDHHCPWINNCCGLMNQKFFILFNFYVATGNVVSCVYVGVFLYQYLIKDAYKLTSLALMLIAGHFGTLIYFLIMTSKYLSEQTESILTNQTLVETYTKEGGLSQPWHKTLVDVMGRNWWLWLVPLKADMVPKFNELTFDMSEGYEDETPETLKEKLDDIVCVSQSCTAETKDD